MSDKLSYTELLNKLQREREKSEVAETLVDSFISNILHEIRTPMNAIVGFSDLMREMINWDEKAFKEYSSIVKEKGNEIVSLFDELIKLSEIDSGIYKPYMKTFRFGEVIDHFENQYSPKTKKSQIILFDVDKDLRNEIFYSDVFIFKKLFHHLIENAINFTHKGYIHVSSSIKENGNLELCIVNSGIDFPVKKPKAHLNGNANPRNSSIMVGGAGIGLAIVKKLVTILGGSIWFDYLVEEGSRFIVDIPVFKNTADKGNTNGTYDSSLDWADKQILVAIETDQHYKYIYDTLQRTNVKIDRVSSGIEAVKYCKTKKADELNLILLDVNSSFESGYRATRELKRMLNNIPVITHTGTQNPGYYRKIREAGSDGFIFSPVTPKKLIGKINSFFIR